MLILYAVLFFILLVLYKQKTNQQALLARWELVDFISKAKKSTMSKSLDSQLDFIFLHSTKANFLPKGFFILVFAKLFKKQALAKANQEFKDTILADKKEHELYKKAITLMIKINFKAAPHWYVIAVFVLGFISLSSKLSKRISKKYEPQAFYINIITAPIPSK